MAQREDHGGQDTDISNGGVPVGLALSHFNFLGSRIMHYGIDPFDWHCLEETKLDWWMEPTRKNSLLAGVTFASSAQGVWSDLKEIFDRLDGSRTFSLHKEIATLQQGRSQILLMSPVPGWCNYRIELHLFYWVDPLAMYSRIGGSSNGQGYNKFKKNLGLVCDFYRCKGHSKEQCYKLIGYPHDFKSKRKVTNGACHNAYMVGNESNATRKYTYDGVSDGTSFNYGFNANVVDKGQKPQANTLVQHMKVLTICKAAPSPKTNIVKFCRCLTKITDVPTYQVVQLMEFRLIQQELYTGKMREIGKEDDELYMLLKNLTQGQVQ
ncbi:hypothetical protein KY285_007583 [Solanum tuberosum]|nr:hypothetical protein KY285_007583 [Solanum tuberosum]